MNEPVSWYQLTGLKMSTNYLKPPYEALHQHSSLPLPLGKGGRTEVARHSRATGRENSVMQLFGYCAVAHAFIF